MSMNIQPISSLKVSGYQSVNCTGNPDQDAKNFAEANGISLAEAKQILSGTFGAPQAPNVQQTKETNITFNSQDKDEEYGLSMLINVPGYNSVISIGNPDLDAQSFADANNISLTEAKQILSNTLGKPNQLKPYLA